MTMYRFRTNVSIGENVITRGSIAALDLSAEKIERLIEVNAISPVASPPLSVLPEWEQRAQRLERCGIVTIEQLLEADAVKLARKLRVQTSVVQLWQKDVVEWLKAAPYDPCCG